MNQEQRKIPGWFWLLAVMALIWNLLGVMAYLEQAMAGQELLEAIPEEQRLMLENRPMWATAAFAIAVWGGAFGSILLLLRKSLAENIFIISLIGILVQMSYNLFVADQTMDYGLIAISTTIIIPLFGLLLIWVSRKMKANGWAR